MMDVERFAEMHPIRYVHIAYAVVIVLHVGYGTWIASAWYRLHTRKKATEPQPS